MKTLSLLLAASLLLFCDARDSRPRPASSRHVGGSCEGCEGMYELMPKGLSWQTRIAPEKEPGEPLEISGVIYQRDGRTPAPDVILYVYHTDATGLYSPAPDSTGWARRHGHLRGWMKTNGRGQYRFITIRPGGYPGTRDPQHIHPIVKERDSNEYYIDAYEFTDDPRLSVEAASRREKRGGSGVIPLKRTADGGWIGRRDIVLGLNIPGY